MFAFSSDSIGNLAMDKEFLEDCLAKGMSLRQIAQKSGAGYSTVRYWLKRFDLETDQSARRRASRAAREEGLRKVYLKCPLHGHTAFFIRSEGGYRCAKCSALAVSKRRRLVKQMLVQEAGGQCFLCGFSEHPAALQFHHLDPAKKNFQLGQQGLTRGIAQMREESKKCVLLCANCHALVEAGVKKVSCEGR